MKKPHTQGIVDPEEVVKIASKMAKALRTQDVECDVDALKAFRIVTNAFRDESRDAAPENRAVSDIVAQAMAGAFHLTFPQDAMAVTREVLSRYEGKKSIKIGDRGRVEKLFEAIANLTSRHFKIPLPNLRTLRFDAKSGELACFDDQTPGWEEARTIQTAPGLNGNFYVFAIVLLDRSGKVVNTTSIGGLPVQRDWLIRDLDARLGVPYDARSHILEAEMEDISAEDIELRIAEIRERHANPRLVAVPLVGQSLVLLDKYFSVPPSKMNAAMQEIMSERHVDVFSLGDNLPPWISPRGLPVRASDDLAAPSKDASSATPSI
jgi:hypothetical protein